MRLVLCLLAVSFFGSCNNKNKTPDVSAIKIGLNTQRFERELFSLDTVQFASKLDQLIAKYPSFGENFLNTILSTDPKWSADSVAGYVSGFISSYKSVYDTSQKVFKDFTPYENEIKNALQFVNYYFPQYKYPRRIITYIGPLDGFGDILSEDAFIVGLHLHLGNKYSGYKTGLVQETYPAYISNRFQPSYISINCMKNLISDMYPEKDEDKSLLIQMIEKGKRLYALKQLLPAKDDYQLIGYTEKQLMESQEHEAQIWDLFIQNDLLQTLDNNQIKNYIGESPKTQELGESSPGNIGSFIGWQIVKKYVSKSGDISLSELMEQDAETIFQEAKYKP